MAECAEYLFGDSVFPTTLCSFIEDSEVFDPPSDGSLGEWSLDGAVCSPWLSPPPSPRPSIVETSVMRAFRARKSAAEVPRKARSSGRRRRAKPALELVRDPKPCCKCKQQECGKGYCACYKAGRSCDPARCRHRGACRNASCEQAPPPAATRSVPQDYCACRRTGCQKNYCVCLKNGRPCGPLCICRGCNNDMGVCKGECSKRRRVRGC